MTCWVQFEVILKNGKAVSGEVAYQKVDHDFEIDGLNQELTLSEYGEAKTLASTVWEKARGGE